MRAPRNLKWPTYRRAGNPNDKHGHYYVQHEAAADDDPLVQTNFIYQDADFRGGRNRVCPIAAARARAEALKTVASRR